MGANGTCTPLVPRQYQEEIFCRARQENIIAALDTGSGKTFISTLLIKYITTVQVHAKIIFLAPKVPLVEQQANYLEDHTSLRICELKGQVDLSNRHGWRKLFRENDCFVMTPQIYYNLITHAHWSLEKTALIVFDECHHTHGNHPYMKVMREYAQLRPDASRPKIFGLTASPLWNEKNPAESLKALEKAMDCKIVGVREHVEELHLHAPKPKEIVKEYLPCPSEIDYPHISLLSCLDAFNFWADLSIPWSKIKSRYDHAYINLGPFCAELYLYHDMKPRIKPSTPYLPSSDVSTSSIPSSEWDIILDVMSAFDTIYNETVFGQHELPLSWFTPKFRTLVLALEDYFLPSSQGIVFVEQRQIAYCLSKVLPLIPLLDGKIRCRNLIGENESEFSIGGNGRETVKKFRDGEINLVIATSIAEEGLNFPKCDVVIRFDRLTSMIGYVQSRGRARDPSSRFIVMVESGDAAALDRYNVFSKSEPHLRKTYQTRHRRAQLQPEEHELPADDDDEHEEIDTNDLLERERLAIDSTGAVLTYDNAVSLINYLCSLIPTDDYTPACSPQYTIVDFRATVVLPSNLPLPNTADHKFTGPIKHSKKEAKRAVSFMAVKRLHELEVFDDYLLPVLSREDEGEGELYAPNRGQKKGPSYVNTMVLDPFVLNGEMWIHGLYVDGVRLAGLVTGTCLPSVELWREGSRVEVFAGAPFTQHLDLDDDGRAIMEGYTKICIRYFVNRKQIPSSIPVFLVPLVHDSADLVPDFEAMERLIINPGGSWDWTHINNDDIQELVVVNACLAGHSYLLHQIKDDMTPLSQPPTGSREALGGHETYHEYFRKKWYWKRGVSAEHVPITGPLVEVFDIDIQRSGRYSLIDPSLVTTTVNKGSLFPQRCCRWLPLTAGIRTAYSMLLPALHRISDVYRANHARHSLGLPRIDESLLIEALTIPSAVAGYSNQRLETLGDGVLQLLSTVHFFIRYPNRHEGQLTDLRKKAVSNASLKALAMEVGLPAFIISEIQNDTRWLYLCRNELDDTAGRTMKRANARRYPVRSLQDCMEAMLGASFLTGGIPMAIRCGMSLGMAFGGCVPWSMRDYGVEKQDDRTFQPAGSLFGKLQDELGYTFKDGSLLTEASTHPSFLFGTEGSDHPEGSPVNSRSYERLEFLGDALIDLVVVEYLYNKFPDANSDTLSRMRAKVICNSALSYLAIRRLYVPTFILCNSLDLTVAINLGISDLESISPAEIVRDGWKYDPPKPLSDVVESIFGAVLVDSQWDYDRAKEVVLSVMGELLEELDPQTTKDPVSLLMEWCGLEGCANTQVTFRKCKDAVQGKDSTEAKIHKSPPLSVFVHGTAVTEPVSSTSRKVTRGLAAEKALEVLREGGLLAKLCVCKAKTAAD